MISNITLKNISLFILLFINFIFAYKYLSRVTSYALFISLGLAFLYYIILKKIPPFSFNNIRIEMASIAIFCIGSIFIWMKIPVESLNVDRWSVITSFWDAYFSNNYVYFAKSNVGNPPGPMPFYFLLALPFYLINELGYLSLLGIILFYLLMLYNKTAPKQRLYTLIYILSSLPIIWEVISRSNIFFNSCLILMSMLYFFNQIKSNKVSILTTSLVIGITLSTRNVFAIPYLIMFFFFLKNKNISFRQLFAIGMLSILVFIATFIPFVYDHWNEFLEINPFIVQSTFLVPFYYNILFILLTIGSVFLIKEAKEVFFYSGVTLFICILIYIIYHIFHSGFHQAFHESIADISYFILCIPFLLWHYIKE